MAVVYEPEAVHCRYDVPLVTWLTGWKAPIPFCYNSRLDGTGTLARAEPDGRTGDYPNQNTDSGIKLGFGGVIALSLVALVVIYIVTTRTLSRFT